VTVTATAPRGDVGGLWRLALPLAIGHLGQQFMTVVDNVMLGRYSEAALGGSGAAGTILFALMVLFSGTLMGLDPLVSQALGAGEEDRARRLLSTGVRLALVLSVPLLLLLIATAWLLPHTGMDRAVADEGSLYLLGRMPGMPASLLYGCLRSTLQARRITRPIMIAMVVGNLVNAVADWIFIFGDDGLADLGLPRVGMPALGTFGAALATSIVSWCSLGVCALAIRMVHAGSPAPDVSADQRREQLRSIIRIGLPIGLQLLAEVGLFALTGILAGTLGARPAAAHQVALVMASLSYSTALGIGAAASVQVGRAIGAGDVPGARRAGRLGILLGSAVMGAAGVVFLVIPGPIALLISGDPDVVAVAVPLVRIAALFQLSDAVQAVSAGALRGAGDTRSTMVFNLVGHYAVGVPVAVLLCFAADLGAIGLWWGLSAGLTTVAVAQTLRFAAITRGPLTRAG
jgi:MATE family multidrug resistance protein